MLPKIKTTFYHYHLILFILTSRHLYSFTAFQPIRSPSFLVLPKPLEATPVVVIMIFIFFLFRSVWSLTFLALTETLKWNVVIFWLVFLLFLFRSPRFDQCDLQSSKFSLKALSWIAVIILTVINSYPNLITPFWLIRSLAFLVIEGLRWNVIVLKGIFIILASIGLTSSLDLASIIL